VSPEEQRRAVVDLQIDQLRTFVAGYDARQNSADSKIAGFLTAAVALASLTVAGAKSLGDSDSDLVLATFLVIALAVVLAVLFRVAVGFRRREEALFSTESEAAHAARKKLVDYKGSDLDVARELTLDMWRLRSDDAHRAAIRKDVCAGISGLILVCALGFAIAVVLSIDWTA
jgi:hypothetical protein